MYILGINGGVRLGYRDASAVLTYNGKIIAAVEEERLNRIKSSPHQLPELAIRQVLEIAKITIQDVVLVATHGSTWGEQYEEVLKNFFQTNFGYSPAIKRFHHHDCHAAGSYFSSGFKEALVFTFDNSGDGVGTQVTLAKGNQLKVLERKERPNSLGIFYAMFTQYCGFVRDSDEYKLMGLAPFGKPNIDLSDILKVDKNGFELNLEYIQKIEPGQPQPNIQQAIYSEKLIEKFGKRRLPQEEYTQFYKDFAASAQYQVEQAMMSLIRKYIAKTGIKNICISGGVGLNCAANKKILEMPEVEALFVQPASGDAGISQGAAYLANVSQGIIPEKIQEVYWGKAYSNDEILESIKKIGVKFQKIENPAKIAAELVADEKVIGWFQGRMEFGPRALGNRSILANPLLKDIQSKVNQKIKFREGFRPFCPSILEEDFDLYFEGKQEVAPYMTINYSAKEGVGNILSGVIHVNQTARIQTVNETQNPLYYKYLQHLKNLIGHGVSLNTSFNVNHQPIVEHPIQAIYTFYGSGLDALIIGEYLLEK
jgi:carbamoyltransferase